MKIFFKILNSNYFWLLLILTLGFFLRTYHLSSNPAGFFCDEAAIGYNAHQILNTLHDEYDVFLPFFFRSFGSYRNPLPIYLNVFSVALFGLNEFSVRFTTAFLGTLNLLLIFLLTQEILSSILQSKIIKIAPLLATFLLAISPWHIHFSRFGSEYLFFPFFITLSFWLFLKGLKNQKLLPLSFFSFGLTLYTYYPAWLVVPLFLVGLIFFHRHQFFSQKKVAFFSLLIFLFCTLPLFFGLKNGQALTRWQNVNLLKQKEPALPRFLKTYAAHFSFQFLFTQGDIDYPGHFIRRFSSQGVGELYLFQLPFLFLGFFYVFRQRTPPLLSLFWLTLLYPLGSSLADSDGGGPFAFRSIIGVIPLNLLIVLGVVFTLSFLKNLRYQPLLFFILLSISFFSFKKYFYLYHHDYPLNSSDFWGWQFGPRDVMKFFLGQKDQYNEFFLMGNFNSPEIFLKFYDPQNLCQSRCQIGGTERLDFSKKQLFAIVAERKNEIPAIYQLVIQKTIFYPNQTPAFFIAEIKPKQY